MRGVLLILVMAASLTAVSLTFKTCSPPTDIHCLLWMPFRKFKNGTNPASFCLFPSFSMTNRYNWLIMKKRKWSAWDSNPGPQTNPLSNGRPHQFRKLNYFLNRPTPASFSFIFGLPKQTLQFLQQINVKNVHPVYGAGIRTHNLQNVSLP